MPATIFFCLLSVTSMVFFRSSKDLGLKSQVNVYGELHPYSARGYMTNLPTTTFRASTWATLVKRSYAGLMLAPLSMRSPFRNFLSEADRDLLEGYQDRLSPVVYIQATLLLAVWLLAGRVFCGIAGREGEPAAR